MGRITILGVGLEAKNLTLEAAEILKSGARIILHTDRIGLTQWLRDNHIDYTSLDTLYENASDFDLHARLACEEILKASQEEDILYCVYDIRDRSVAEIMASGAKARIIAGPPMEGALMGYGKGAVRMLEASDWVNFNLSAFENALIREIDTRALAGEVKLKLMECYPEESTAYVLSGDGSIARVPLYDMDRLKKYDHRTCAFVAAADDITKLERYGFDDLVRIMNILQAPDGCSWDRAQTHESLRTCMLEETYEVIEAINDQDSDHLYDELGDLMMNIVMQAIIAEKHGEFELRDSTTAICRKMIERHTHIFGGDTAGDPNAVMDLWTRNKMKERGQTSYTQVLQEVSKALPAIMRAEKIIKKAAGSRIEYSCKSAVSALRDIAAGKNADEQMVGDAFWEMCRIAQTYGIDGEIALNSAADRFIEEFSSAEGKSNVR